MDEHRVVVEDAGPVDHSQIRFRQTMSVLGHIASPVALAQCGADSGLAVVIPDDAQIFRVEVRVLADHIRHVVPEVLANRATLFRQEAHDVDWFHTACAGSTANTARTGGKNDALVDKATSFGIRHWLQFLQALLGIRCLLSPLVRSTGPAFVAFPFEAAVLLHGGIVRLVNTQHPHRGFTRLDGGAQAVEQEHAQLLAGYGTQARRKSMEIDEQVLQHHDWFLLEFIR